jgi:hypothetical protein
VIKVRLELYEMQLACLVGKARNLSALVKSSKDAYPSDSQNAWGQHIDGAGAELAFAKFIGLYWDGSVDTYRSGTGDLPFTHVDVKHSRDGKWKVKERDRGELVLVRGTMPEYIIEAYCTAEDVKKYAPAYSEPKLWAVPEDDRQRDFASLRKKLWRRAFDAREGLNQPPIKSATELHKCTSAGCL